MDGRQMKPAVLARIPDLASSERETAGGEPPSRGRVVSQALSFKLLAGAAVLLAVMAVVPSVFRRGGEKEGPATASTPTAAWSASPPAPSAAAAPRWTAPVVSAPASTPIPASPSPMPDGSPAPKAAGASTAPVSAAAALMSPWPNPTQSISSPEAGNDAPRAAVNQAMAIPPSEHSRNNYDSAGSSVH
jgi:hypothetical protein